MFVKAGCCGYIIDAHICEHDYIHADAYNPKVELSDSMMCALPIHPHHKVIPGGWHFMLIMINVDNMVLVCCAAHDAPHWASPGTVMHGSDIGHTLSC